DEPFFVKNLENIQGDERDVILISVGYGRDRDGFFSMNFGPVQNEGGERRLNVLISRARRRCEVFSSIHAGDIDLRRAKSAGARVLKQYLRFAETGELELPIPLAHDFDSDFEEEVARALRARDYEVEAQVGTAGFRIDLAVRDPEDPGTFILGVECDGRTYHSARWARDRDRLRQLVLEQRGWKIHRIWSTDWFRDPEREIQRVIDAIETSRSQAPLIPSTVRIEEEKPPVRAGEARAEIPEQRSLVPYVVATGPYAMSLRNSRPDTLSRPELAQLIGFIVEKEQPIHRDEIARRVAAAWGLRRTREPVRNATNRALEFAVDHGMLHQDGDFFSLHPERWVAPRDRSEVRSSTLKKAEYISPLEVRTALRDAVRDYVGLTKDEACVQAARMLGFHRTGADLQAAISQQISTMLDEGLLKLHDRKLYTDEDSSAE
ncbi:MAG TPA: DUF3320 domain-containing protein, partial [Thermoanaerobaculia bacterium]|nr:DUF3320 domain-containing protein [Thermoanaerobaculia bacterium]